MINQCQTKKKGIVLTLLFLIFLISSFAYADIEQAHTGITDGNTYYVPDLSIWTTSKVTEGEDYFQFNPLGASILDQELVQFYDLNDNNTIEMVFLESNQIKVYTLNEITKQFDLQDSITVSGISDADVFDIQEVHATNYIVVGSLNNTDNNMTLHTYFYNGTLNFVDSLERYDLDKLTAVSLSCANNLGRYQGGCVTQTRIQDNSPATYGNLIDTFQINSTGHISLIANISITVGSTQTVNLPNVFPRTSSVLIADVDADGFTEAVVLSALNGVQVRSFNSTLTTEWTASLTTTYCLVNQEFSGISAWDFDGAPSNGLEVLLGCTLGTGKLIISINGKTGGSITKYPSSLRLDGNMISNVMQLNCMTGSGAVDAGLLGYDEDEDDSDTLEFLCASEQGATDAYFTSDYDLPSVEQTVKGVYASEITASTSDDKASEIFTPYGVFAITDFSCAPLWLTCNIDSVFSSGLYGVHRPIDMLQSNLNDIVVIVNGTTSGSVYYLDDGFTNTQPILEWQHYPSMPVCVDEFPDIRLVVTDSDSDNIDIIVSAYFNHPAEQNVTFTNISSGSTNWATYNTNVTISNGNIRIFYKDVEHSSYQHIDIPLTVSSSNATCHAEGDGTSLAGQTGIDELEEDAQENADFRQKNKETLESVGIVGSSMRAIVWLAVMILVGFIVFKMNLGNALLPALAVTELFVLLMGWLAGFISGMVIVTIALLLAFLVVVAMAYLITQGSGGG